MAAQISAGQIGGCQILRGHLRRGAIGHFCPNGPIKQACIEMGKAKLISQAAAYRALTCGRRPINGDRENQTSTSPSVAPSPRIRSMKMGNEVVIGPPSSICTGSFVDSPKHKKDMAIR